MTFKLIKAGVAVVALLITALAAQAADIPRPVYKGLRSVQSYYNWSGFYVGANAGYGWGKSNWDDATGAGPLSVSPKGLLFGGTVGYNYQAGSWVWGIEGDFDWSGVKGDGPCPAAPDSCETKSRWLSTVRGRIGYAFDRWLPYFTGGGAYGNIQANTNVPGFPGSSSSKFGWTLGGGLEYAFLGNWTAKIEYLFVDLGKFDCGISCGVLVGGANNVSFNESVVRVGVNYKFSGPIFSRY